MTHRPDAGLVAVDDAWLQVRRALDSFTDEQARGPSRLPGRSRAGRDSATTRGSSLADTPTGLRTIADLVASRRREMLVHLVDLDLGVTPRDLPADYLTDDAGWITGSRPEW